MPGVSDIGNSKCRAWHGDWGLCRGCGSVENCSWREKPEEHDSDLESDLEPQHPTAPELELPDEFFVLTPENEEMGRNSLERRAWLERN